VGKAKIFSDDAREAVYQKEFDNEIYNYSQQNTYNLGSTHFSDQSGIGNFLQSGRDQRNVTVKGSLIQGNFGFLLQTAKLDVGTFTIDLNNDSAGVVLSVIPTDRIVTLSSGTTSDLTTITGAQRQGQRLRLYNISTNTITIKHTAAATVNTIRTPTATDLTFPGNAVIDFTFDITTAQWRVVGNTGSGGGGTTLPVIDTTPIVKGSADATKLMRFEVDTLVPTATTVALTVPAADTTLAGLSISPQTFTGITAFTGSSFSVTSAVIILGDATSDTINVGGRIGTDLDPSSDVSSSLGSVSLRWLDIYGSVIVGNSITASTSFSSIGSTFLGDGITDTISFGGRVNTDIIPILDADDDLGTNILRWDNIYGINVIANTVTASVSFSSTGTTTLGDDAADNIFFGGQIATQMVIEEISSPSTPPANTLTLYAKLDGGFSKLFYKQEDGTEVGPLTSGGAGSQTPWLQNIDGDGFDLTDVGSIVPRGDGVEHLGGASNAWDDLFTDEVRFTQSGAVGNKNSILADSGGMNYNSLNSGSHDFYMNGNARIRLAEDGEIEWLESGRLHSIIPQATSLDLKTQNQSDDIIIFHGSKSNATWNFGDLITTYKTSTTELNPLNLQFFQNNDTPATNRVIVRIEGYAENSISTDTLYSRVEFSTATSITNGSENGRIQLEVRTNGAFANAFEVVGHVDGLKMGFFGVSEVVQQSVASDTLANLYTAMRNYGLIA